LPNLLGEVPPESVLPSATLATIRALEHFVVETPKIARRFLSSARHPLPLAQVAMQVLDEHTPPSAVPALLAPALAGHDLGLLSDAGCPAVADPGARLVAAAHARGIRVLPLVGPSAIVLGLMASGLNGQGFAFHGYLPARADARERALVRLEREARATGSTQIFIEAPYRNLALLASVLRVCRPDTVLCTATDLTLPSEAVVRLPVSAWSAVDRGHLERRPTIFLLGRD